METFAISQALFCIWAIILQALVMATMNRLMIIIKTTSFDLVTTLYQKAVSMSNC